MTKQNDAIEALEHLESCFDGCMAEHELKIIRTAIEQNQKMHSLLFKLTSVCGAAQYEAEEMKGLDWRHNWILKEMTKICDDFEDLYRQALKGNNQ